MRTTRVWLPGMLLVAASLAGNGCVLLPEIKEKIVQLAAGGTTTVGFEALGLINAIDQTAAVDVAADVDLAAVLDGAGIDASDVKAIKVSGISYRVVRPDPEASRQIQNATVTARRGSGAETPIITDFTETVNSVKSPKTAPLDPAGVALINGLLADMLTALQAGTPVVNPTVTYRIRGTSAPASVTTDFTWEIKINVSVVGEVKVSVPE